MRLIDADALKDDFAGNKNDLWNNARIWAMIDAAPTANAEPQWVSVEDALPEDERDVLARYGFDDGDGNLGRRFTGVLQYYAFDPQPHFQHEGLDLRVTHWMPLPEPPEEGNK